VNAQSEPATRRRGPALESAIFTATLEQLAAAGFAKLTMEGVAEAAGTGKAALYRRWASKEDLVFDALLHALPRPREIPQRATVREDLIALLECYKQVHSSAHGAAFRALKEGSGEQYSRVHDMLRSEFTIPVRQLLLDALARGAARGEVRPGAVSARVASLGPAMMSYYCMTEEPLVPEGYIESIVDEILIPLISPGAPAAPGPVTGPGAVSPPPDTAAAAS
jgi:AcrR family transcriptional regulator